MKWAEQRTLFEQTVAEERKLLNQKGAEYAGDQEALANFKQGAADVGIDPKQVLYIYLSKHLASIRSFIQTGRIQSTESIHGRIHDARNYLFLLECLIHEAEQAAEHEAVVPMTKEQIQALPDFGSSTGGLDRLVEEIRRPRPKTQRVPWHSDGTPGAFWTSFGGRVSTHGLLPDVDDPCCDHGEADDQENLSFLGLGEASAAGPVE